MFDRRARPIAGYERVRQALEGCGRGSDEAGSQVASTRGSARPAAAGGATPSVASRSRSPHRRQRLRRGRIDGGAGRRATPINRQVLRPLRRQAPRPRLRPRGAPADDICEITPDAPQCAAAKEINFGEAAKKKVNAEVYAVQQDLRAQAQRFEIMPYYSFHAERSVREPHRAGPRAQLLHHATSSRSASTAPATAASTATRTSTSRTAARRASRCRSTSTRSRAT